MYPTREFICIVIGTAVKIYFIIKDFSIIDNEIWMVFYFSEYKIVSIVYINQQIDYDMKGMKKYVKMVIFVASQMIYDYIQ